MKKILLFFVALVATLSMNAQTTEIYYNGTELRKAYSGADVTVSFDKDKTTVTFKNGTATASDTYCGPDYKVVSKELPPPPAGSIGKAKRTGDIDVNWVQLWEGGPKFAEYNVGAKYNTAKDYGGYYCWGKAKDKDSQSAYKDGTSPLTGTDDTATNLWGSNWRMPTKDELQGLLANCDVEWTTVEGVNGRKFTGRDAYASNSIFLPAADNCTSGNVINQNDDGCYWSSTPDGSDSRFAYRLLFYSGSQSVASFYRKYGYSVRAVYDNTKGTAKATIGGQDVDVKWIQLWENGPKFAEYNVGVTDGKAEGYGGYYCWGKATDKDSQGAYKDGTSALTGTDDTATNLWGSNWRMPTNDELQALIDNCDVLWTDNYNGTGKAGRIYTGKGDYLSNSVFLPAAGHCIYGSVYEQVDYGYYWSSTPDGSDEAYDLYFTSGFRRVGKCDRHYGYPVRAVLKELPPSTGTAKATIGGQEVDVNWVQLWENGPKFAEKNVGASSATDVGSTMTFAEATEDADYVWGANWCTPSKDQMDELLKAATSDGSQKVKCEYIQEDGKWGFKFTGKETGYTGNSVFFPAQDVDSLDAYADYWSATADGSKAWSMGLHYDYGNLSSDWYSGDQEGNDLVRPVLNEPK